MSFLMTHLIVAKNLTEIYPEHIVSLPQYYLGSAAPDAVHNRDGYISDYKKVSHLVTGDQRWGMTKDNDGWRENVVDFYNKNKNSENHDFILGYCIHILTDIYNNVNAWLPFITKYPEEFDKFDKGQDNIHHQDSIRIDRELALTYKRKNDIWDCLKESYSIDIPGIIYASEIKKQKDLILNVWYKDIEHQDLSVNTVRTFDFEIGFIKKATEFVAQVLSDACRYKLT